MSDDQNIDFMRSQIQIARWHLEQATAPDFGQKHTNLGEARRAYEAAVALLPLVKVSGTRRVELVTELAELGVRLRDAGVDV